ncbi:2-oxo-3-hexenedioate decarboxylase [Chromobacterium sp. ATCC 53434]|uniref:2-oxo-3-hexenedioate decarboxylase n=1 Tax=Chromobacterium TaxID=535 RepID=UPI000C75FD30|nr:2-oxo-3-hexenedioate decarboxylase [Chromobacterium sp. ATCC 53434]AUH50020.1 2-oxo-3-hexenedioate decarboxylase [Chromobacterium sp. ATCC 53434]
MNLDRHAIARLAEMLESAEIERRAVVKITEECPDLDQDDAYAIQDEIRRRKEARGVRIVGYKMGLTSLAKMRQMGVAEPVRGFLTGYGYCVDGASIATKDLIHPKAEAEIAFVLKRSLTGPGCTIAEVLAATDFVVPAVEIIDSRYLDFKFDVPSVIADNTSAARFVVGGGHKPVDGLDLKTLGIVLEKNGVAVATAAGAAVLGHPAQSVAMLANMLAQRGETLSAGAFIMTGGATEAIPVKAGDSVTARYQGLGSLTMRFV